MNARTGLPRPKGAPRTPLTSLITDPRILENSLFTGSPWDPTEYELWVESGVVWDLKRTWILGFIDYGSIAPYFAATPCRSEGALLSGAPFSKHDFPIYGYMSAPYNVNYLFSALSMLPYVPTLWKFIPTMTWYQTRHGETFWSAPPSGSGPLATATQMQSFIAGTPGGDKTFSAQYVCYAPPSKYWTSSGVTWPVQNF